MQQLIDYKKRLEGILNSEISFFVIGLNYRKSVYFNELKGKLKENVLKSIHREIKNIDKQLKELGVEVDNTASSTKKKEYPKIIDLSGKCGYDSQIWILEEKESTETKLQYYGYDACVFPLPKLSKTSKENQKRVLGNMGNKLKDVNMEIWLDDIRLKKYKGE